MPEQLALEQLVCDGSAVHVQEGLLASPALVVYSPRHDALTRSRLSKDDHPGVADRRLLGHLERGPDRRAFPHELRRTGRPEHATQRCVLTPEPAMLHGAPEGLLDQRGFHRLSEIVKRTELHGLDAVRLPGEGNDLAG